MAYISLYSSTVEEHPAAASAVLSSVVDMVLTAAHVPAYP